MGKNILNKVFYKIAEEVHKSRINDLENRILEMEKKHEVILKSLQDNEADLVILERRLNEANFESAKAIGAIETLVKLLPQIQESKTLNLNREKSNK